MPFSGMDSISMPAMGKFMRGRCLTMPFVGDGGLADIAFGVCPACGRADSSLDAVPALPADDWQEGTAGGVNFGFTELVVWLHFTFHNPHNKGLMRLIEVGYPQLDHVSFFERRDGRLYRQSDMGDTILWATPCR